MYYVNTRKGKLEGEKAGGERERLPMPPGVNFTAFTGIQEG